MKSQNFEISVIEVQADNITIGNRYELYNNKLIKSATTCIIEYISPGNSKCHINVYGDKKLKAFRISSNRFSRNGGRIHYRKKLRISSFVIK